MKIDTILTRDEGAGIALEIRALRRTGPIVATVVGQSNGAHWQSRIQLDEAGERWIAEYDNGDRMSFSDGVLRTLDEGLPGESFPSAMPEELRMAMPEVLMIWGRGHESFSPMLAQHVGTHSLLLTFEHNEDPAFRQTLVIDRRDGIARRSISHGRGFIVTHVSRVDHFGQLPAPDFEPITDWIRTDY